MNIDRISQNLAAAGARNLAKAKEKLKKVEELEAKLQVKIKVQRAQVTYLQESGQRAVAAAKALGKSVPEIPSGLVSLMPDKVLAALRTHGPIGVSALADKLGAQPKAVGNHLGKLKKARKAVVTGRSTSARWKVA